MPGFWKDSYPYIQTYLRFNALIYLKRVSETTVILIFTAVYASTGNCASACSYLLLILIRTNTDMRRYCITVSLRLENAGFTVKDPPLGRTLMYSIRKFVRPTVCSDVGLDPEEFYLINDMIHCLIPIPTDTCRTILDFKSMKICVESSMSGQQSRQIRSYFYLQFQSILDTREERLGSNIEVNFICVRVFVIFFRFWRLSHRNVAADWTNSSLDIGLVDVDQ
ncbi:hypothetical protein ANN_07518 [Periplaneta americana]|uniref:Uncharacterized protein n=1 Tax=Periplaneta americana TaxID=6978 RepID=A0ABQ8T091_PERAM|nr:hypothetical protein ANN_07518 [Periplaneta americana]